MSEEDIIIDLNELSNNEKIYNSDIILSILEICTYNKRYNYECSNNTKSFWERVVKEEVLKKIFKNFKPETLRKYWKIIREAGDVNRYIEVVKNSTKFINSPKLKLLQIINCISSFIKSGEEDFFKYLKTFDPKQKYDKNSSENSNINEQETRTEEIFHKISDDQETNIKVTEDIEPKMILLDNIINEFIKITKYDRGEIISALYGTNNIENAYLYLTNKEKYKSLYFNQEEDSIIINNNEEEKMKKLIEEKGEKLVKERKKFLKVE